MKIGLALSGGGARGIAHLGVLKALLEQGIQPAMISGVSAGAIAGALYAAGYHPDEVLEIIISTNMFRFLRPAMSRVGILKMERTDELYLKYLTGNEFEKLNIPLIVSATNLNLGETVYFSRGELIKPLQASSCIPVLFEPVRFNGNTYVDGGILNNLPVEPLLDTCDFIIGVHTNPYDTQQKLTSVRAVMERSLLLAVHYNVKERVKRCDLFIEPGDLRRFATFDLAKGREIFDIGYQHTMKLVDQLTELKEKIAS
ncbi:MAG: patatin-like phospholipase family protein [Ferruginibacter sp.]|nr:patatin-like phospholipase family protein [Cytophagales bacterium]